jgi:hypothetical protein
LVPFALPAIPALSQTTIYYQMAALDPIGSVSGFTLSDGLQTIVDI